MRHTTHDTAPHEAHHTRPRPQRARGHSGRILIRGSGLCDGLSVTCHDSHVITRIRTKAPCAYLVQLRAVFCVWVAGVPVA